MITPTILTLIIGLGTILTFIFSVWNAIRKPQEKSETNDAVFANELKSLSEKLTLIQNNDLHELKGMFNTHILNQNSNEREVSDKLARQDERLKMIQETLSKK